MRRITDPATELRYCAGCRAQFVAIRDRVLCPDCAKSPSVRERVRLEDRERDLAITVRGQGRE